MKVKELIILLQTLEPDCEIFIDGYDGGIEDIVSISKGFIIKNRHLDCESFGDHDILFTCVPWDKKEIDKMGLTVEGYLIGRSS